MSKLKQNLALVGCIILFTHCSHTSVKPTPIAEPAPKPLAPGSWQFAISGDSRNCGDVVMPTIAKDALKHPVQFYWHLGDFRALYKIDEDFHADQKYKAVSTVEQYQDLAWEDFIQNEIAPFGKLPVYLGIGNHELVNKTRDQYVTTFKPWLNGETLTYSQWIQNGVAFINLDNASNDQFDRDQMRWFMTALRKDQKDKKIHSIVVGMHKALPDSISFGHSMSESKNPISVKSGRAVYRALLKTKNRFHKNVYILGSHSHFFMDGTFNTQYWKTHGGVLPGWIVGTAGAVRYELPKDAAQANQSKEHTYGYLLATVSDGSNGTPPSIQFDFQELGKDKVPTEVVQKYGSDLVTFCFEKNAEQLREH